MSLEEFLYKNLIIVINTICSVPVLEIFGNDFLSYSLQPSSFLLVDKTICSGPSPNLTDC